MNRNIDHDRFVAKNRSLAVAEEIYQRDEDSAKKGVSVRDNRSCFNCKMKQGCSEFKARRSGRATGVVSFGGDERFICDRYVPAPAQARTMSDKQIKALLKNIKKGF
ncbi:MAG: hypothetical protein JW768_14215 [Chitinispirillaceae bacterium]|nr:hypothetical protein [Chitinispirillaceae bacterium]